MHDQCEDDDDRQRDADQPEKNAFAETHLNLLRRPYLRNPMSSIKFHRHGERATRARDSQLAS
jgi:hypothetical protein